MAVNTIEELLSWQLHYEIALDQRPEQEAGTAGVPGACPLATSLALALGGSILPLRGRPWRVMPHMLSCGPFAFPTPRWARLAAGKVDIRGRGRPVPWGQWTAILAECRPDEAP